MDELEYKTGKIRKIGHYENCVGINKSHELKDRKSEEELLEIVRQAIYELGITVADDL